MPAGGENSIEFNWTGKTDLSFDSEGEYRMYIRKQAGTYEDPIKFLVEFPNDLSVFGIPNFTLTTGGYNGYNTTLIKDRYFLVYHLFYRFQERDVLNPVV